MASAVPVRDPDQTFFAGLGVFLFLVLFDDYSDRPTHRTIDAVWAS
jgi:hypothetical protein